MLALGAIPLGPVCLYPVWSELLTRAFLFATGGQLICKYSLGSACRNVKFSAGPVDLMALAEDRDKVGGGDTFVVG